MPSPSARSGMLPGALATALGLLRWPAPYMLQRFSSRTQAAARGSAGSGAGKSPDEGAGAGAGASAGGRKPPGGKGRASKGSPAPGAPAPGGKGRGGSRAKKEEEAIRPDAAEYWRGRMDTVTRSGLGGLVGSLDWAHPLGLTRARARGYVQRYEAFLAAKAERPTAVVIVRVNDRYEAVGFDALVLCQVCGLSPTSPHTGVSRAGFPRSPAALRRHLNKLIGAAYTVAVVEEVGGRAAPARPRTKAAAAKAAAGLTKDAAPQRLVCVVSASSPYFLAGDVEDECPGEDTPLPKPVTGVSVPSSGGYRLMRFCPTNNTVQVHSQLSAEALVAQLHASGLAQPLHLHASVRERERAGGGKGQPLSRMLPALLGVGVSEYGTPGRGGDAEEFVGVAGRALGLDPAALAAVQVVAPPSSDAPVPPSLSTVTQLGLAEAGRQQVGLEGGRGVPSLLSAALPDTAPAACRDWLRRLLLLPPPPAVAECVRAACAALAAPEPGAPPRPRLVTSLPGPRVAALLAAGAAGPNMMRDLQGMLLRVVDLLSLPGPSAAALQGALGGALGWSLDTSAGVTWGQVPPSLLAQHCSATAAAIAAVVPGLDLDPGMSAGSGSGSAGASAQLEGVEDEATEEGAEGEGTERPPAAAAPLPPTPTPAPHPAAHPPSAAAASLPPELRAFLLPPPPGHPEGPAFAAHGGLSPLRLSALAAAGRLVRALERFRWAVRPERMPAHVHKVAVTRAAYVRALIAAAGALEGACGAVPGSRVVWVVSREDSAVWARLVTSEQGYKLAAHAQRAVLAAASAPAPPGSPPPPAFLRPLSAKLVAQPDRLSTAAAEAAAAEYRLAVAEAEKESRRLLRQLCAELSSGAPSAQPPGPAGAQPPPGPAGPGPGPGGAPHLLTLLAAAEVSIMATALAAHVERARAAGWNWPSMPPAPSAPWAPPRLSLPALAPYWLDRRDAVPNDVVLGAGRMALLTGPNMAGKSTILRSVAAAALLATCGLAVPAGPSSPSSPLLSSPSPSSPSPPSPLPLEAPWFAHVSLRNFSGDSPLEGKSAFAVEMEDTAATLAVAGVLGPRALVLLDELGKGTEVVAGTALAAAVLIRLLGSGCAGVFASHLHDLPYMLRPMQRAGRLEFWAMDVEAVEGGEALPGLAALPPSVPRLRPTWRVRTEATCLRSMALQVAASCGMPPPLLTEAVQNEGRLGAVMAAAREGAYGRAAVEEVAAGVYERVPPPPPLGLRSASPAAGLGAVPLPGGPGTVGTAPLASGRTGGGDGAVGNGEGTASASAWGAAPSSSQQAQGPLGEGPGGQGGPGGHGVAEATVWALPAAVGGPAGAGTSAGVGVEGAGRAQGSAGASAWGAAGTSWGGVAVAAGAEAGVAEAEQGGAAVRAGTQAGGAAEADEALASAAELLRGEVRAALERAGRALEPEDGRLHWVGPDYVPHTGHAGEAVVYVLRRWDGLLYVGESEDVAGRLRAHRAAETRERRAAGRELKSGRRNVTTLLAVYALVPRAAGGKSGAQDVEAALIRALQRGGRALRSDHDRSRAALHRPQLPGAV
ncbi:hypothetical protein HYH03_009115 [Edaphochlamys debaryana]|uniref:DNA mismatch repair proteins mutS family domain-containing protein n=1 Tax=Edaphochlamys debaryana TaxID=47281 RepID=A0A836BY76_9CHLO|nr:hypothetical protein HYH03_009115 [Edaphochlamys debaryana]|eukprot:KAG2492702.1 hypothetical protein HYH03_009115 [Edaphochlamys debaryana]